MERQESGRENVYDKEAPIRPQVRSSLNRLLGVKADDKVAKGKAKRRSKSGARMVERVE